MPNLYIVSGCNGSGKTTASYALLPEMLECYEFVNSDEFAKALAPFAPERMAIQACRFMLLKIKHLFKKNVSFGIETTLATRTLIKTIKEAQKAGYEVTVLYFWLDSPQKAIERVKARVESGGHNIPTETIVRRYYTGLKYLFNDYMSLCDRWILADNSEFPFRVIAEGKVDETFIKDKTTFDKIVECSKMEFDDESILKSIQD